MEEDTVTVKEPVENGGSNGGWLMEEDTVTVKEAVKNGGSDGGYLMEEDAVTVKEPVKNGGSNDGDGDSQLLLPTELEPIRKNVRAISPPPFLTILYNMVDDPSLDSMISWGANGDSFVIYDTLKLSAEIFPKFFRHDNIASFIYQLNNYGFKKISWERPEYFHEFFMAGKRELLKSIKRRDQKKEALKAKIVAPVINSDDLTKLKKDQSKLKQLMESVVQRQKATEQDLNAFRTRIEDSISRQEQMLTLLAETLTPSIISQLKDKMGENIEDMDCEGMNKRQKLSTDDTVEVEPIQAIQPEGNCLVGIDRKLRESGNVESEIDIKRRAKLEMVFEDAGWNWAQITRLLDETAGAATYSNTQN